MKNIIKILLILIATLVFIAIFTAVLYIKIIPAIISNSTVINFTRNKLKQANIDLAIDTPELTTSFKPEISFSVKKLSLKNQKKIIVLDLKNIDINISLAKLLEKKIIINKIGADYIFVDINKISELTSKKETKESQKSDWSFDLFNCLMYLKEAVVVYENNGLMMILKGQDIKITETRNPKFVHFNLFADIIKDGKKVSFKFQDKDTVYTNNRKLYAKNTEFFINNSKIVIDYVGAEGGKSVLNLHSNKFNINDVAEVLNLNFIIPNGSELMSNLKDIKGDFDFNFHMDKSNIAGDLNINKISFLSPTVKNLPVNLSKGKIIFLNDKIVLSDFKGYYGKTPNNTLDISGIIKDYKKNMTINIVGYATLTKELTNEYISDLINYPIELLDKSKAKIKFNMANNKMDFAVIFRLIKGNDILVDGLSMTPVDYERAFRADMQLVNNNFELKNLNYYIADSFTAGVVVKPLLKIFGNFDIQTGKAKNIGFNIEKPLPSEFLNVLIGQRVFKKGTISGNLEIVNNKKKTPYLTGDFKMDGVRIPSQRLSIKSGEIKSNNDVVNLNVSGRYKRANYDFTSKIANELTFPLVVKDINLKLDNVDVERLMSSVNNKPQADEIVTNTSDNTALVQSMSYSNDNEEKSDEEVSFNTDLVVVEHCLLQIVKGVYKQINFGNVNATMTLNRQGILDLDTHKFDIAGGHSGAKVKLDLKKQLYEIKLGIKDVDSDIIATSLLNLPREISGKAKGIIFINTDKSMKLNGFMKFDIVNGTIAKVGLIEYALNFVSLFRNPLAMISPATFIDLTNVPEGKFDKITGSLTLKDNVIGRINIKSQSPQLASFIIGRYDLEKSDAILRIYTKFSNKKKGMAGVLRNISLNSLANKVPLNSRNDANYYESEIKQIPDIQAKESESQIFLTKIDGDVEHNNFLSTLKRIK